jgi:hypothetical protein
MKKSERLKKELSEDMKRLDEIIHAMNVLECGDRQIERAATNHIIITMFELMDNIAKTETEIYEYLRRRGWISDDD